jgi:hypothetical protein
MESTYQCRTCKKQASEPVISTCGHMFCWSCADASLTPTGSFECPVCSFSITKAKLTAIYISEEEKSKSSANPRPRATRQEAQSVPFSSRVNNFFDFSRNFERQGENFFSLSFLNTMNRDDQRADILSKLMLIIGLIILVSVLF